MKTTTATINNKTNTPTVSPSTEKALIPFAYIKDQITKAIKIDLSESVATVSISADQRIEKAFTALSDDEKKIIKSAVSAEIKDQIKKAHETAYKSDPLKAVSFGLVSFTIPAPYGKGKPDTMQISCKAYLSTENRSAYDTYVFILNRIFAFALNRSSGNTLDFLDKERREIKFFLDKSFKLFTNSPIRANEKDATTILHSGVDHKKGKFQTKKETALQLEIETILRHKIAGSDYLISLVSENKNTDKTVPVAIEFQAPANY
nr:MAG TPA: hypothetical protein [Caudoviricetes sp.]